MTDQTFAPPASQLGANIPNTVQPTPGQGLVLDVNGKVNALALQGIYNNGILVGNRTGLNFVSGATLLDNPGSDRVDVTIVSATELVSVQVTTDTSNSTLGSDTDLVTFSATTFTAVKHYLEIAIPNLRQTAAGNSITFKLKEGAGQVGNSMQADGQTNGNGWPAFFRLSFTPTAASHTYKITWVPSAGTASMRLTGLAPAEFRIVKA